MDPNATLQGNESTVILCRLVRGDDCVLLTIYRVTRSAVGPQVVDPDAVYVVVAVRPCTVAIGQGAAVARALYNGLVK